MSTMSPSCRRFRNAICILHSIDGDEFERSTGLPEAWWRQFRDSPAATFLRLDSDKAEAIWRLVEARQSDRPQAAKPISVAAE